MVKLYNPACRSCHSQNMEVVGLVGSIAGLTDIVARSLKNLLALQSAYSHADLTVTLLIGQLATLNAALGQIGQWVQASLINRPQHGQLVLDIKTAIDSCRIIMLALETRIASYQTDSTNTLTTRGKISYTFEEQSIKDFTVHLGHQVSALQLLVQAAQCRTVFEQDALLRTEESRRRIQTAEDDGSSLLRLSRSRSLRSGLSSITDASAMLDVDFEFDEEIFGSRVYRNALRSALAERTRNRAPVPEPVRAPNAVQSLQNTSEEDLIDLSSNAEIQNIVHTTYGPVSMHETADESSNINWFTIDPAAEIVVETTYDQFSSRDDASSNINVPTDTHTPSRSSEETQRATNEESRESIESRHEQHLLGARTKLEDTTTTRKKRSRPRLKFFASPKEHNSTEPVTPQATNNVTSWRSLIPKKPTRLFETQRSNVLLLGAGFSGKSTLLKSLQLYSQGTFGYEERNQVIETVVDNVWDNVKTILGAMVDLKIKLSTSEGLEAFHWLGTPSDRLVTYQEACAKMQALWVDPGVKECIGRYTEFQLDDSAAYFLDNVERIMMSSHHDCYVPTDTDILRSRVKTLGMYKTQMSLGGCDFLFTDTGGERVERKKWIHSFKNASAMVYVSDISAYDLLLREDENVNRMQEDLTLFDSLCNSQWFVLKPIILLFTKIDVLKRKLAVSSLKRYMPGFKGDETSFEEVKAYLTERFCCLNRAGKNIKVLYGSFFEGPNPAHLVAHALRDVFEIGFAVETQQLD